MLFAKINRCKILLIGGVVATVLLSGCVGTQPTIPMTKDIQSFKDYIVKKRGDTSDIYKYNIIAEKPYQTIIEYRTENETDATRDARDVMEVLGDAKEYCQAVGGNGIYGDQSIRELESLPTAFSIDYVKYRQEMTRQGFGHYSGFYKCASTKDGFEIDYMKGNIELQQQHMIGGGYMQTYSRYYHLIHDKAQKNGSKFWSVNEEFKSYADKYSTAKEAYDVDETGQINFKYERIGFAQKYCSVNGGDLYIANGVTKFKKMSIDDYYFARLEQIKDKSSINIFMDKDYIWCENPNNKSKEFTLVHNGSTIDFKQGVAKEYLEAKGVSFAEATVETIPSKTINQTKELSKETLMASYDQKKLSTLGVEQGLATYTLASKTDTYKSIGQIQYETSYNGIEQDGCEYASVTKRMMQNSQIQNFKQCNGGQISYVGGTGVEELTDEAKEQLQSVSKRLEASCKLQNQAVAKINEFTFKCFKNPLNDSYKFVTLKDGKLILKVIR
ncbi:MAG: hypothetical protein ACOX39_04265 [Arcobacteraceae bacterium]